MNTLAEHPEHIVIEPNDTADACVIMMHGLGTDGHDMNALVDELDLHHDMAIRFILPHAPMRQVTINNGEEMRAWFDFIPHSEQSGTSDLEDSSLKIASLMEEQIRSGLPSERILLAGFSQGGVLALHTGLRFQRRLAGVLAMSAYLHDVVATELELNDANLAIPVMMAHGTQDPMIPIMRAATSRENLIRLGYDVRWHDYPMGHQVCIEELQDIAAFFYECFGNK